MLPVKANHIPHILHLFLHFLFLIFSNALLCLFTDKKIPLNKQDTTSFSSIPRLDAVSLMASLSFKEIFPSLNKDVICTHGCQSSTSLICRSLSTDGVLNTGK